MSQFQNFGNGDWSSPNTFLWEEFWMGSETGLYKNRNTKEKKCETVLNVAEEFE